MKKTFKDTIINTVRRYESYSSYNSYKRKNKYDSEDSDYWNQDHGKMSKTNKSFADRISPLKRFLISKVGKPWNDVWKEICQNNDNSSVPGFNRGWHLRHHVLMMVSNTGLTTDWPWRYPTFIVDSNGILQHRPYRKYKVKKTKDYYSYTHKNIFYFMANNIWFKTSLSNLKGPKDLYFYSVSSRTIIFPAYCAYRESDDQQFTIGKLNKIVNQYVLRDWKTCSKKDIKFLKSHADLSQQS